MLLSGELPPGKRLIESRLAESLGVSRTPVREALRRLESDGLVYSVPNAGCVVADFLGNMAEIYLIRERLESLAAARAAENIGDEAMQRLTLLQKEMREEVASSSPNIDRLVELNRDFHSTIYSSCGSVRLERIIDQLVPKQSASHAMSLYSGREMASALREHDQILEALDMKDAATVDRLVARHMRRASKAVSRARLPFDSQV